MSFPGDRPTHTFAVTHPPLNLILQLARSSKKSNPSTPATRLKALSLTMRGTLYERELGTKIIRKGDHCWVRKELLPKPFYKNFVVARTYLTPGSSPSVAPLRLDNTHTRLLQHCLPDRRQPPSLAKACQEDNIIDQLAPVSSPGLQLASSPP
jgi:hypothetical protein